MSFTTHDTREEARSLADFLREDYPRYLIIAIADGFLLIAYRGTAHA